MIEPEVEIRIRNVEYHQRETAVSAYLLGDNDRFIAVTFRLVVLMLNGINNIRYHDDRHHCEPVIIKPTHECILTKTKDIFKCWIVKSAAGDKTFDNRCKRTLRVVRNIDVFDIVDYV